VPSGLRVRSMIKMTIQIPWYTSAVPGTPLSFSLLVARKNNPSFAIA
jgi:hypothetical protein